MIPHVGIDLGTTFSCMCYIGEQGAPLLIKNSDGQETTPSVVWFDGRCAYVGKKANVLKLMANSPIYEFVKRDMGKESGHRYVINGYNYGAYGLSAIILKKLKMEAYNFFKRNHWLAPEDGLESLKIPAVITVPAYFYEKQRLETRIAGISAGFDVLAIINEPTAAALTYGIQLNEPKKILVFDMGGGTFDVTIIEIADGNARAIVSDGADQLGGKDFDSIIETYIYAAFERITGREIPDDLGWEIQKTAIQVKMELSEADSTKATIYAAGEEAELDFFREREFSFDIEDDDHFYFEERCGELLMQCKSVLTRTLADAAMSWHDIDDIVLAGGASRMPMIPKMLESIAGRPVKKYVPGFSFDTAIATGAAIYGRNRSRVVDVTSKSIGIELKEGGRSVIEHLIKKNSPLPIHIKQKVRSEANAVLKVYEG